MILIRSIERDIGVTLILSKEQDFESEWRVMQCRGSAEQVRTTKQRIDKLLQEAGKTAGDKSAMGLECYIVGSVPVPNGKMRSGLMSEEPKQEEPDKEEERNPIKNNVVIMEKSEPQLKTDQDTGFKRQVSQLFG